MHNYRQLHDATVTTSDDEAASSLTCFGLQFSTELINFVRGGRDKLSARPRFLLCNRFQFLYSYFCRNQRTWGAPIFLGALHIQNNAQYRRRLPEVI